MAIQQRLISIMFSETSLYFKTNTWQGQHYWSTISHHLLSWTVFLHQILKIKPNVVCQVLDGYALTCNEGDSNGKTLIGWVLYNYFRTLIMAAFLGGLLMEVQLMWFSSSQMQNAIKRGSYYIWRRPAIIIVYKCVSCKHNILK